MTRPFQALEFEAEELPEAWLTVAELATGTSVAPARLGSARLAALRRAHRGGPMLALATTVEQAAAVCRAVDAVTWAGEDPASALDRAWAVHRRRRAASKAAHAFGNHLQVLLGHLELARAEQPSVVQRHLDRVARGVSLAGDLVGLIYELADDGAGLERDAQRVVEVAAAALRPPGPGRVLLVDDDPTLRAMLRVALEREGWVVADAGTASDARRMAEEDPPQAMVVDLGLPDDDGVRLARSLRALCPAATLVLASGSDDHELARAQAATGADAALRKPFRPKDLVRALLGEPWDRPGP